MISGSNLRMLTSPAYSVHDNGDRIEIIWNMLRYSAPDKTTYIYGRDYNELFERNNLSDSDGSNLIHDFQGKIISADARYVKLGRDLEPHDRRSRFWVDLRGPTWAVEENESIKATLGNKSSGRSVIQRSPDAFLSWINKSIDPSRRRDVGDTLQKLRVLMNSDNVLISLNGLEDSIYCLTILNSAFSSHGKSKIIIGPSKYKGMLPARQIPRPLVSEKKMISLYATKMGSSIQDTSRHLDQWSVLPANSADIRNGKTNRRHLTHGDVDRFLQWEPDVEDEIPAQIPGTINASVHGGRLVESEPQVLSHDQITHLKVGVAHLLDLIQDVEDSSYLGNWSRGAINKLDRLKSSLEKIQNKKIIFPMEATAIALKGESFRLVYAASFEELSTIAKAEFAPLIAHMDLIFSQLDAWKKFKDFGASIAWGSEASKEYREALEGVAKQIENLPEQVADTGVRNAMKLAAEKINSDDPIEKVEATAAVRNVLSGAFRYIKSMGSSIGGGVKDGAKKVAKAESSILFQSIAIGMREKLIRLAHTGPKAFGWIMSLFQ